MCKGKLRFKSQFDAVLAANRFRLPYGRPYRCPKCGRWHLTSKKLNEAGRNAA